MMIAPHGSRDRLNLVRNLRSIQVTSYIASLILIPIVIVADPQHRLISLAIAAFNAIVH